MKKEKESKKKKKHFGHLQFTQFCPKPADKVGVRPKRMTMNSTYSQSHANCMLS